VLGPEKSSILSPRRGLASGPGGPFPFHNSPNRTRGKPIYTRRCSILAITEMFQTLYGQTAAALYAKAAGQNAQARQLYNASADTYYKANDAAAYDDWVRARNHWDYFYNRS
jgi:hypothetical protein